MISIQQVQVGAAQVNKFDVKGRDKGGDLLNVGYQSLYTLVRHLKTIYLCNITFQLLE